MITLSISPWISLAMNLSTCLFVSWSSSIYSIKLFMLFIRASSWSWILFSFFSRASFIDFLTLSEAWDMSVLMGFLNWFACRFGCWSCSWRRRVSRRFWNWGFFVGVFTMFHIQFLWWRGFLELKIMFRISWMKWSVSSFSFCSLSSSSFAFLTFDASSYDAFLDNASSTATFLNYSSFAASFSLFRGSWASFSIFWDSSSSMIIPSTWSCSYLLF